MKTIEISDEVDIRLSNHSQCNESTNSTILRLLNKVDMIADGQFDTSFSIRGPSMEMASVMRGMFPTAHIDRDLQGDSASKSMDTIICETIDTRSKKK